MWNAIKSNTIGSSHLRLNGECQDYCNLKSFKIEGKAGLGICISDGAGSAKFSRLGATLAVEYALSQLQAEYSDWRAIDQTWIYSLVNNTKEYLSAMAQQQNLQIKDFACTFLFAMFSEDTGVFAQIGDGCWVIGDDDNLISPTWPYTGDYANETIFLTSNNALELTQFKVINQTISYVAGFTDGLQNLLLDFVDHKPFDGFFIPFVTSLRATNDISLLNEQLTSFLSSEKVSSRTDDDKTLVIAWRDE